jgi:hypothetical protein
MGTSYTPFPLHQVIEDWLKEIGVPYSPAAEGRYPSLVEIRQTIQSMPDYPRASESIGNDWWNINVGGPINELTGFTEHGAVLRCIAYSGDENEPGWFYYYRGDMETIVAITERLSRFCGPFLIYCEAGGIIVVTPGTPADAEWY